MTWRDWLALVGTPICVLCAIFTPFSRYRRWRARAVANARLIAAAPDMLAALEEIVRQVSDPANAKHQLDAFALGLRIADARAAIAKATGADA